MQTKYFLNLGSPAFADELGTYRGAAHLPVKQRVFVDRTADDLVGAPQVDFAATLLSAAAEARAAVGIAAIGTETSSDLSRALVEMLYAAQLWPGLAKVYPAAELAPLQDNDVAQSVIRFEGEC